ncbi:MAG: 6,7-dimethyl-8-ribityllumazine synthase [Proteobacteria bacterium]|jgi:6,7-dimethyl-8-ribityllumazine synthase|nr:6,7-dimethyl-8-ribityllumazine synthase [Pseudomonadota bacterium]
MTVIHEGILNAQNLKIAVVVTRFNSFITERLIEGALDTIKRHGGNLEDVEIFKVPGCFEIPVAADKIAASGKFSAIVCLGALIRGATPHFDYIAAECTKGIAQLALNYHMPISYGVITADTLDQAIDRAGTKAGNKGAEAALAAIEMAQLFKNINL